MPGDFGGFPGVRWMESVKLPVKILWFGLRAKTDASYWQASVFIWPYARAIFGILIF